MDAKKLSSYAVTIAMIAGGIYIGYKHRNKDGFWYGVLALALIGSYLSVSSNGCTEIKLGADSGAANKMGN